MAVLDMYGNSLTKRLSKHNTMQLTQDSHFFKENNELPQAGFEPTTSRQMLPIEPPRQLSWLGPITHTKQHNSSQPEDQVNMYVCEYMYMHSLSVVTSLAGSVGGMGLLDGDACTEIVTRNSHNIHVHVEHMPKMHNVERLSPA